MVEKLLFLGFVIGSQAIQVDESKVKAISEWPVPSNLKELQNFQPYMGKFLIVYFDDILVYSK